MLARKLAHGWIPARAAQMSFYYFLSVFPLLLIVMAVLSQFRDAQQTLSHTLLRYLAPLAPPSMLRVLSDLLTHLAEQPKGALGWGIAVGLWAASSGMVATIDGLNEAYAVAEVRAWWKRRLTGLTLTLIVMLILTVAMLLMALGVPLAEVLAQRLGFGAAFLAFMHVIQWPVIVCIMLLAFDLLYHFGPNRRRAEWRWFPLEAVIAITFWLAASFGLKVYMFRFGNYSVVYGAVGGVIVLLLWFYLTAIAILVAAHIAVHFQQSAHGSHLACLPDANEIALREQASRNSAHSAGPDSLPGGR